MLARTKSLFVLTLFVSMLFRTCLAGASEMPRYKLKVGQQFKYKSNSEFKYDGGSHSSEHEWTIWVASANDDGGWRLIVKQSTKFPGGTPSITFAYLDLGSDGSYTPNPSLGYRLDPTAIFIPIPKNEQQAEGSWQGTAPYDGELQCRHDTESEAQEGTYLIDVVRKSPMDEIYEATSRSTVTFDTERGIVQQVDNENTQGYGINGKGTGETTLESVEMKQTEWLNVLNEEANAYFEVSQRYDELIQQAVKGSDTKELLEQARSLLDEGQKAATHKTVTDRYSEKLSSHDRYAENYADQASRRAQVVGKPAFDFSTQDFDGETHALKSYRGKVVILDFWYRGCGWCIRAMPQMKEVAETFADQPVLVFGMNTDQKEEDALFVIEKMQLNYANLKAKGLPEQFKVRGFPTLVIIDQKGVVRDLHVGYSVDLAEQVAKSVRELLAES